jgi:ferritin-like metal-binding protein YciE
MNSLKDLYRNQLAQVYQAKKESLEVLPILQRAAAAPDLASAFGRHLLKTREHVRQLENLLDGAAVADGQTATRVASLIYDCAAMSQDSAADPDVRDAAIIAAVQHLKHDEIAGLGCTRTWARLLGDHEASTILQDCLNDEKQCDAELIRIAQNVNGRAARNLVLA